MQISFSLPENVFVAQPHEAIVKKICMFAALCMYQAGELSIGAACELAGVDRYAFLDFYKREGGTAADPNARRVGSRVQERLNMLIIADSSALIALATCQGLGILLRLYDDVKVPQAVYSEVVSPDKPSAGTLVSYLSGRVKIVDMAHRYWPPGIWDREKSRRWRSTRSSRPLLCSLMAAVRG